MNEHFPFFFFFFEFFSVCLLLLTIHLLWWSIFNGNLHTVAKCDGFQANWTSTSVLFLRDFFLVFRSRKVFGLIEKIENIFWPKQFIWITPIGNQLNDRFSFTVRWWCFDILRCRYIIYSLDFASWSNGPMHV